jgi:hypothetical protein
MAKPITMKRTYTKSLLLLVFLILTGIYRSYGQPGVGIPFGLTVGGAPVAPTFANAVTAAAGADESKVIFASPGFSMPFAGTSYPLMLTSTNGWVALLPASDLSASVATTTNSAAVAANATTITLTSAAGVVAGMYVSGTGILGGTSYAQVLSVAANVITINVGSTAVAAGAGTYNFFNLLPAYFATALPTNALATYAGARPIIAPLWDDLSSAILSYNLTAGVYAIKWTCKWDKTNASAGLNFFVTLNSASGNIAFNYPNVVYTVVGAPSGSIGIAGVCTGDYYSVNPLTATTATYDSTFEYSNQTGTPRLNAATLTWNPFSPNDNCSGARPAKDLGTITSSCTYTTGSNVNATTSGSNICATADNRDVWYKFTKPAGVTNVLITTIAGTCQPAPGTTIEAFASCGGASLGCATTSVGAPGFGELALARSCASEVLYVRVTVDGDATTTGKFQICVKDNGGGVAGGTTCSAPTYICSLTYTQTGLTTAGSGNEYDSTNTVCHSLYARGEDYIFTYTPTVSQCIRISVASAGTNPGVFIYNNCPDSSGAGPTYCLGSAEGITGTVTINSVTLTAGTTYYIMVDNQVAGGNIPFDISVTSLGTSNSYDNCATPINLGSIGNGQSCVFQTFSTECSTPSAAGTVPIPSCIPTTSVPRQFIDGVTGDVWLTFTAAFTGALQIVSQQSGANPTANAAMAIYQGSCGSFTQVACDNNSGTNSMPSLSIPITTGQVYYIRFWSENPESQGNFDICLQSACAPPNDLPCGAINVPIGGTVTGFNTCTGALSEPANAAQCVAGGTVNTVWYKTVVPASGQVHIRTHPLTLTDTQIQAYTNSGGCGSVATFVSKGCNDDGPGCSGGFIDYSDLALTGLTPNDTLYIAVDGTGSLTGSFELTIIDGTTTTFPPVNQQDCAGAQVLCSTSSITVADPGFRNFGNICDMPGSLSCWGVGERNSIWYQFTVDPALAGGTANVAFDILSASSTDIDVMLWDITGLSNYCASIQAGSLPAAACNYGASSASTGLTTTIPLPYGYSSAVTFTGAPRTYLLLLNNWNSATNAGYTLNWGSTPISTAASTAIWSGGTVAADTNYACSTCWGACGGTPACGIDAVVNNVASGRQPCISSNQSVKNITINAGASLRIKSGFSLTVCGNFTNYGTLICEPNSSVIFIGNTVQTITGVLTGTNSFCNLVITKGGGSVVLANNIDVAGNFTTTNATSVFNINGKYMKVGGNFTNSTAGTTFTNVAGSTVEFNGPLVNQYFTNTNGTLELFNVVMNKNAGKLYLNGANSRMLVQGVLTLTKGIIVSGYTLDVFVKNNASAAITGFSANSYIDGKLRRNVYSLITSTTNTVATVAGGNTITLASVAGLTIGGYVFGPGFPGYCQVTNIVGSVVTLASNITAPAGVGSTFSFASAPATLITLPFSLDYPVGDSLTPGGYNPANITFTSGTVIAEILGYFNPWPGVPPLGPAASECVYATYTNEFLNNGYWTFSKLAPSPFNGAYRMTLTNNGWSNTTGSGWTIAKADVAANVMLPASWSLIGNCVIASTTAATQRININTPAATTSSFNFNVATAVSLTPLPIELLSFDAEPQQDNVLCKWTTASETNNELFEVQKSYDGVEFKTIGTVRGFGLGTSTTNRSYKFVDEEKCSAIRYYRLKQNDFDGKSALSDVVAVNCKNTDETLTLYPNPAASSITYQYFQNNDEQLEVRILDVTGRVITSEIVTSLRGFNTTTTSIDELAAGVYYLQIRSLDPLNMKGPRQTQFFKN